MKTFPKKLMALTGGGLGFVLLACALTFAVKYKPYGVPDSRRAEYEAKVASLHQRQIELANLADAALPVAVVAQSTHDFGMLDPHQTASHAFEIRNEGADPLALEISQTSCKCTVGELGNSLLPPGESTSVTMTWNTGYQADHYQQTATIRTNDPLRQSITLTVQGEVRAELITPEAIAFKSTDMGQPAESSFVVFSQLWNDFTITDVQGDVDGFEWYAEPINPNDPRLADKEAKSAWEIRVLSLPRDYGEYSGKITLTAQGDSGDDDVVRSLACAGKVRAPINFYSPKIHKTEGLDIGTLVAGKEHQFHLIVRARTDVDREIKVLDIKPDNLQASLAPLPAPGNYRLTLRVPADCPTVVFNADQKHGYVQVGDPNNKTFSNWFPLLGAVVTLQE